MREEHLICPNAGESSGWGSLGGGGKLLAVAMEVGGVGGVMERKYLFSPTPRYIKNMITARPDNPAC